MGRIFREGRKSKIVDSYVIGVGLHPPSESADDLRLEEIVYYTARAALEDAGVTRGQLDHVTLGACDEFDGRSISSMLMAMPAGAYLTDEIRVTDSGANAFCLGAARLQSEEFELGLVVSWCKSSKTDVEKVMRFRGDPFYTRPIGLDMATSDALFAQAMMRTFDIGESEIAERVVGSYERAAKNPRGMGFDVPDLDAVSGSPYVALPLRTAHRARLTDGAVCMVLASEHWLKMHPGHRPLARIAGVGWATDSYRLDRDRLASLNSARTAWKRATAACVGPVEVMEIESQTAFHEAAYVRAFELPAVTAVSPSGGPFAQNPLFCTGLVGAAEAVLQVANRAGPVQVKDVRLAGAHSCHGYAQQGNVVMIFERPGDEIA
jgi:acetyl-CoA acetyltransferase